MKKISIEEKQEIYEYLLSIDTPDLLAALIAERSCYGIAEEVTIGALIGGAFYWDESPEGDEFWRVLVNEIEGDESVYMPFVDEDAEYKIEVDTSLLLPALAQAQVNEASEKLLVIPQPEREGLVFKLFEYKYHIGILCSIVVGATVGLRYTGVI